MVLTVDLTVSRDVQDMAWWWIILVVLTEMGRCLLLGGDQGLHNIEKVSLALACVHVSAC